MCTESEIRRERENSAARSYIANEVARVSKKITYQEFLTLVRSEIGHYCNDSYWESQFKNYDGKTVGDVEKDLSYLAYNAIATDMTYRRG